MKKLLLVLLGFALVAALPCGNFLQQQLTYSRVKKAWKQCKPAIDSLLQQAGLKEKELRVFIRGFKVEGQLELWAANGSDSFRLLHQFEVCAKSGTPGPKRKEGDLQVPEGFYAINDFNAVSQFHLALGINYPNASDRVLSDKKQPGGLIYIHGKCCTIGCIPLTDGPMELLYTLCVLARHEGQLHIPVHLFPCRFGGSVWQQFMNLPHTVTDRRLPFWNNLKTGYDYFETHRRLPRVSVAADGSYRFR